MNAAVKTLVIPDNVTVIDTGAFYGNTSLTSLDTGDGTELIGHETFCGCSSLATVSLGKRVRAIGDNTFEGCSSLQSITLPSSVTEVGAAAFYKCSSLKTAVIGNGIRELKYRLRGTFESCTSLESVTLGDGLLHIDSDCFENTALKSVEIPDSVLAIGSSAFCNCDQLVSVKIGDGVTTLGDTVFYDCDMLKNVTIGKGVATIGERVFADCDSLESITIPSNVTSLGERAFFASKNLKRAVIGNGVRELPGSAFGVFHNCTSLESVTLGNGLQVIGNDCFKDTALRTITMPEKVTNVGSYAFNDCPNLESFYLMGDIPAFSRPTKGTAVVSYPMPKLYYISGKAGYAEYTGAKQTFTPVTVTFDSNTDELVSPTEAQKLAPAGGYVIEPVDPIADGFIFRGWYKEPGCVTPWNYSTRVSSDVTLYAKWDNVNEVKPERPENVTSGSQTVNSISLSWTEVAGAASYSVYSGNKLVKSGITGTSCVIGELLPNTSYEFTVVAQNSNGSSENSLVKAVWTGGGSSRGDINADGNITTDDARLALRASVGLESLTSDQKLAADVNSDGDITTDDARKILRASVGLERL